MTTARRDPQRRPVAGAVVLCLLLGGCASGPPVATDGAATRSTTATPVPTTPSASAPTGGVPTTTVTASQPPPPYVARTRWVRDARGRSLQVTPTAAGRATSATDGAQVGWAEVLRLAPDADTPGMRAQFDCHWTYARLAQPDKPSWNLEPWRPVVGDAAMVAARCNPGGAEE